MKKSRFCCIFWWIAGIAAAVSVLVAIAIAFIRYRKVQRVKSCTADVMQMLGNILLCVSAKSE